MTRPRGLSRMSRQRAERPNGSVRRASLRRIPWAGLLFAGACVASVVDEGAALPITDFESLNRMTLVSKGEGLVEALEVSLAIEPKIPGEYTILGRLPEGSGVSDAMIVFSLHWKDFVGVSSTTSGRERPEIVEFGGDGELSRKAPFSRAYSFDLDRPRANVLARLVEVRATLHPIDVRSTEIRSGGARVVFDSVRLESLLRPATATIDELLAQDSPRDPVEIFLGAAQTPEVDRPRVIELLVGALAGLPVRERSACFGALHFLTGNTQGSDVYLWEAWLRDRAAARSEP
jgi:hypothetical protein